MHGSRLLRFLSIPAALGLGTAVIVACSDGSPTAPDAMEVAPAFKKGKPNGGNGSYDATQGVTLCIEGYYLTQVKAGTSQDDDGDTWICKKGTEQK